MLINMKYFDELKIEYVDISILKDAKYNPRAMTEQEAEDLKNSIEEFDIVEPLVVNNAENRNNIIIGGHRRKDIAKLKGLSQVPVVYVTIPDIEKEKELNLRLNKNVGHWDWSELANFDTKLLENVGFDEKELLKNLEIDVGVDEDVAPEVSKEPAISKLGEVYELGRWIYCPKCKRKHHLP